MRKNIYKSWQKTTIVFLTTIFLLSTLTLLVLASTYNREIRNTYASQNNNDCDKWMVLVDDRLTFIHEHIRDLMFYLYRDSQFSKDLYSLDSFTTSKIISVVQNKIVLSDDISAFFVYDINSDTYIYDQNSQMNVFQRSDVKAYLREYCVDNYQYLNDSSWSIINISGTDYFYNAARVGRFVVGAVSETSFYNALNNDDLQRKVCMFVVDDNLYYCAGNKELADNIKIDNLESVYNTSKIVSVSQTENSQISVVLITKSNFYNRLSIYRYSMLLLVIFCIVALSGGFYFYMRKKILTPTNELIDATQKISNGQLDYRLDVERACSEEFIDLYQNFNNMTEQIGNLKIEKYDIALKEEKGRLKLLRAQVKPHTFLNGITTISNMTYENNPEKMRDYIYSFSQFTRYMLNTNSDFVTIKEELNHIENYVEMQKIRFPNSIECSFECEDSILNEHIPYLLLFSLVENSFKHAMSLTKTLNILIKAEYYLEEGFKGIRLIEEDDGDGFSAEVLENRNTKKNFNTKEHLGLTNVGYTLHILYNRDDLLRLSNKETGGVHVEMLVPERSNANENLDM